MAGESGEESPTDYPYSLVFPVFPEFPAIYLARFGLQLGELTYHPITQSPSETRSQAKT